MSDRDRPLRLVEVVGHLPFASNTTVLAEAADGSRWVYKPASGEQPLWDFPWRSLATREALVYEVSRAMGVGVVPETLLAAGPMGPGSAQRFLDEDTEFDPRPMLAPTVDPILWPIAVLDVVTNNADRKIGHLLRDRATGDIWAIDNGLTFHPRPKLRTVLWGFAGQELPPPMIEALERLWTELDTGLCDRIGELLSPLEADALSARVAGLLQGPVHPEPPDDRPALPWPIW